jgi:hypothetical protein
MFPVFLHDLTGEFDMLIPYPTEFPREALTIVLDLVRGQPLDVPASAHACWCVAGYALSQTLGGGPVISGTTSVLNDESVIKMAIDSIEPGQVSQGLFPWGLVLSIVLKLLVKKFGS